MNTKASNKFNGKLRWVLVACIVAILVFFIVFSLDKFNPFVIPASTTATDISNEYHCDDSNIIVDKSGTRVLFLDKNNNVVAGKESGIFTNPVKLYYLCACDKDYYYVSAYIYKSETDFIETEQVLRFSKDGSHQDVIVEMSYDTDIERHTYPTIDDLALDEDNLYISRMANSQTSIQVIKINKSEIDTKTWDFSSDYYRVVSKIPNNESACGIYYFADKDKLVAITSQKSVYSFVGEQEIASSFVYPGVPPQTIVVTESADGEPVFSDHFASESQTFNYSFKLLIRLVSFWLGIFALALLCLIWLIIGIKNWIVKRSISSVQHAVIGIVAVFFACGIVIYYSSAITQNASEYLSSSLSSLSNVLTTSQKDEFDNCLAEYKANGMLNSSTYNENLSVLQDASNEVRDSGVNVDFLLIAGDKDEGNVLIDSNNLIVSTSKMSLSSFSDNEFSHIGYFDYAWGRYVYASSVIQKDGQILGRFTAIAQYTVFNSGLIQDCMALFITLLATMMTISFIVMEIKNFVVAQRHKNRLQKKKYNMPECALARPLFFFAVFICSTDSALISLIAYEILSNSNLDNIVILSSLPLLAISVGYAISVPLHSYIYSKFKPKTGLLIGASLSGVSFGVCFFAVLSNNFILLLAGLIGGNAGSEIIYLFATELPMAIKDKERRSLVNRQLSTARISASSIAILLSGFVVAIFGNSSVYLLAVILCIMCILYIALVFPKKANCSSIFDSPKNKVSSWSKIKDFLSNPSIVVLAFCILAVLDISAGYKSYAFPLISASEKVSKTMISNIIVFVNALIFYSVPIVSKFEKRIGSFRLIVLSCIIMGASFITYIFNYSVTLSIVILFIECLATKTLIPSIANYWHDYVTKYNKNKMTGQKVMYSTECLYGFATGPILGALLGIGFEVCIGFLGLLSIGSGFLFLITGKIKKSDK